MSLGGKGGSVNSGVDHGGNESGFVKLYRR